jgi:molybdopterin-guanine dinucleotide biosynthesis protein A
MGSDKALLPYFGVPMAVCVATSLRGAGCDPVVAIGGDTDGLTRLGFEVVPDIQPGEGPLGGVLAALERFPLAEAVVAVACDLPLLTAATVEALVDALRGAPAASASVAVTDRVQPLCVAWRPAASSVVREEFVGGERRVRHVLARLVTVEISANPQDLANVNTPSDLPK